MMTDPIDLGTALDTVVERLAVQFPTFKTVVAEDEQGADLPVPAIIVQFSEIEPNPDADAQTGQLPCLLHVEARVIMGHRTPKVRREVIKAAGAIGVYVHSNRLGIPWGAAIVLAIEPDEFAPAVDTFDIWRIEWVHSLDLGDSYFVDDAVTPTEVFSAFSPDTGAANESGYTLEGG